MNIQCVVESHDIVGESPIWHPQQRCIYWVDLVGFRIRRLRCSTGDVQTWQFDAPVTTLSLTRSDKYLLVALGGGLILWNPVDDERRTFVQVENEWPQNRLNDGAAAPDGSFWVGSMQNNIGPNGEELSITQDAGSLYRVNSSGQVKVCDAGFGITNTIAWSPDESRFYCGCSRSGILYAYGYDKASGVIGERSTFAEAIYPGVPDGSAVDANGTLWNCRHSGGCILGFASTGELVRTIEFPTTHVTNCVFGDDDLRTLYVTTAALGAPHGEQAAGNLFSLRMKAPGLPPYRFAI